MADSEFLVDAHVKLRHNPSLHEIQDLVKQVGEILSRATGSALENVTITAANPLTVALLTASQHCEQAFSVISQQSSSNIVQPQFGGPVDGSRRIR